MNKYIYALGFFDGVHLGHQQLLHACCRLAEEHGCKTAAITFDRHPKSLFTENPTVLISSVTDRKLLLNRYGIGFELKESYFNEAIKNCRGCEVESHQPTLFG